MFQSKGESLQQQEEASLEPASRLQSLRDRDTVTRFDREVSVYFICGHTGSSSHDCTHIVQSSSVGLTPSVLQVDPDRAGRHDAPLTLGAGVKFREAAKRVRLETRAQSF